MDNRGASFDVRFSSSLSGDSERERVLKKGKYSKATPVRLYCASLPLFLLVVSGEIQSQGGFGLDPWYVSHPLLHCRCTNAVN